MEIKSIGMASSIFYMVIVPSIVVSPTEINEFIELENGRPVVLGGMQPRFRL